MSKIPFLKSMVVKLSDFHSNVLQCRLIFIRLYMKVPRALLLKMKYNRYGLLVSQCSKLHISALYKLTESVQSLSKFLLVKSPGLPRPGCKCIAFYWSLQRSAAQWLPLDGAWTLWWWYTTSFIYNIIDMIPLSLNFLLWFIHACRLYVTLFGCVLHHFAMITSQPLKFLVILPTEV